MGLVEDSYMWYLRRPVTSGYGPGAPGSNQNEVIQSPGIKFRKLLANPAGNCLTDVVSSKLSETSRTASHCAVHEQLCAQLEPIRAQLESAMMVFRAVQILFMKISSKLSGSTGR